MKTRLLHFSVSVIEDERLLNGRRRLTLEGASEATGAPTLTLSVERPKEREAASEEGDLTLTLPEGQIWCALASGRVDSEADDSFGGERDIMDLLFDGVDGEDGAATGSLRVRIHGVLHGDEGEVEVEISANDAGAAAIEPSPQRGE